MGRTGQTVRSGQAGRPGGLIGRPGALAPLKDRDPQRIGEYRIIGRLGEGGMGQVFLARSDRGRTVAVKLVRGELADQEEFRARFRREVQAGRRVGGEWTAPVLDADTEAETPWVATGYIAGPSLQQAVAGGTPLPERTVRILASGLALALESIHTAGIIHRDLKPSNVLLTIDGPRVIDFGIARALDAVTGNGLTRTGAAVGSPGFMSPEQVRGETLTPASDVFCLGSVLMYAATGRQPFGTPESGVHAVMYRIAQEEPDLSALPKGLHDLIAGCLAKDPAQRPTPAQLLAQAEGDGEDGADNDEPWLPGTLIARLGRHAVELLEAENPKAHGTHGGHGFAPTPPDPAPVAAPAPRRRGAGTALMVAAALILAGAGATTAYVLLNGKDNGKDNGQSGNSGKSKKEQGSAQPAANGGIPAGYLGTWETTLDNSGTDIRRFTLTQGKSGDTVLKMTASGARYQCEFAATLESAGPPVRLGPSTVVSGPATSCHAGSASSLELVNGKLRRAFDGGKAPSLYRRVG